MRLIFLICIIFSSFTYASDDKVLATWLELIKSPDPNFYQLKDFITNHDQWPKLELFRRKIEENNFNNCKDEDIIAFYQFSDIAEESSPSS